MRRDEEAALHVVEALLAGMIILTAVLFMTNLAKPSPTAFQSGIDLERVSVDTLRILENRPADNDEGCDDPSEPDPCYPNRLDQIVSHAMGFGLDASHPDGEAGDQADKTDAAERFLNQVIPVGNRWLLRLDNGEEPLVLLPTSGSNVALTPRGAKAAETFFVPQWQAHAGAVADGKCGPPPSDPLTPGGDEGMLDIQATDRTSDTLAAPTGSLPPVGSDNWADWWLDQQASFVLAGDPAADTRVPPTAPYGWWWHDANGDDVIDAPAECHFIGLPDDTATDYPAYGVQLVVWPIAG